MNNAKKTLINNIMTMPDDFSEEAIVLQLLLREAPAPYQIRGAEKNSHEKENRPAS